VLHKPRSSLTVKIGGRSWRSQTCQGRRHPCFRFTTPNPCILYSAFAPPSHLVTTASPSLPGAQGELHHPLLCAVDPAIEPWLIEPCVLIGPCAPAVVSCSCRAAAQTRCHLRASHRAEPVDSCRYRCLPQRACSLLCIVLTLFRRAHAESLPPAPTRLRCRRSARTRTYT
jgi:hypothetical protein